HRIFEPCGVLPPALGREQAGGGRARGRRGKRARHPAVRGGAGRSVGGAVAEGGGRPREEGRRHEGGGERGGQPMNAGAMGWLLAAAGAVALASCAGDRAPGASGPAAADDVVTVQSALTTVVVTVTNSGGTPQAGLTVYAQK